RRLRRYRRRAERPAHHPGRSRGHYLSRSRHSARYRASRRAGPAHPAGRPRHGAGEGAVHVRARSHIAIRAGLAAVMVTGTVGAADFNLLPPSVELNGPEAYHQLLAEAAVEGHQEDWTRAAQWSSSDPNVATVDAGGLIRPAGDGQATITARAQG